MFENTGGTSNISGVETLSASLHQLLKLSRDAVFVRSSVRFERKGDQLRPRHACPEGKPSGFASWHEMLWDTEGYKGENKPQWKPPTHQQELQVWHDRQCYIFTGVLAAQRLHLMAPKICATLKSGREAVAVPYVTREHFCIRVTAWSLARSAYGASKNRARSIKGWIEFLLQSDSPIPQGEAKLTGYNKNLRYWESLTGAHTMFRILSVAFPNNRRLYGNLSVSLIGDSLTAGLGRSPLVETFLREVEVVVKGNPSSPLQQLIFDLPNVQKAYLYRFRRVFIKDDNLPIENCTKAIKRMSEHPPLSPEQFAQGRRVVAAFQKELQAWIRENKPKLARWVERAPLHRASATILQTRSQGGGGAEAHLIVGLYRLSQGKRSALTNVFGELPEKLDLASLLRSLQEHSGTRQEILDACTWFLREVIAKHRFPRLFCCIYPERETKSRTFMLFDYATQLGCSLATSLLYKFLKTRNFCKEAFAGMDTRKLVESLQNAEKKTLDDGEVPAVLSLDSATSTDPLPHEFCMGIYEPLMPYLPPLAQEALKLTFAPNLVAPAIRRPKDPLILLDLEKQVGKGTGLQLKFQSREFTRRYPELTPLLEFEDAIPKSLPIYKFWKVISQALRTHRRVLLKSATGTGKTVLAASAYRSIIQFPSIANLELFGESCKFFGIPYNRYYSRVKEEEGDEWSPFTFLTTGAFVIQLAKRFPHMLIVLDEAECRQEDHILNVLESRELGFRTLLMSATPEALLHEDAHHIEAALETRFPVEEKFCSLTEMVSMVSQPDFGKTLICAFSEPFCEKLASQIGPDALVLNQQARRSDFAERVKAARVIVSTNVVRSSVTIDGLLHVFDIGMIYESVDYPLQGFRALNLFQINESGRQQLRGRVGRVGPGVYWRVSGVKRQALPHSSVVLGRLPKAAALLNTLPLRELPHHVNQASLLIEAFTQTLITREFSAPFSRNTPQICTVVKRLSMFAYEAALTVLFEEGNLPSQLSQLENMGAREEELYRRWKSATWEEYPRLLATIINTLEGWGMFGQEIFLLRKWLKPFPPEYNPGSLWSEEVQKVLGLYLWRQVGRTSGNNIVGQFRDFSLARKSQLSEGNYICLGLTFFGGVMDYRVALPLRDDVFEWLREVIQRPQEIEVAEESLVRHDIPIISIGSKIQSKGNQSKLELLSEKAVGSHTVYDPDDLPHILEKLAQSVMECAEGECTFTCTGSPMSSVASFGVLNGLALGSALLIQEDSKALANINGFGDDALGIDSERRLRQYIENREAVGLSTKWEATGLVNTTSGALGLYTERFFDLTTMQEIPSFRPRGVINVYKAYHPQQIMSAFPAFRGDLRSFVSQMERRAPEILLAAIDCPDLLGEDLAPVRSTAPRRLVLNALAQNMTPGSITVKPEGLNDFIAALESAVLLIYPSVKGEPNRVGIKDPLLGYPLVTLANVKEIQGALVEDRWWNSLASFEPRVGPSVRRVLEEVLSKKGTPSVHYLSDRDLLDQLKWHPPNLRVDKW